MAIKKEFNAKKGLKGYDPEKALPMKSSKNALEKGHTYIFEDTGETAKWGNSGDWPVVRADDGILCNAPYIAGCMLDGEGIVLNKDMHEKFHCMHTPRSAKAAGIKFDYVNNHLTENETFPKITAIDTYPIALKREDLINNSSEDTKKIYQQVFGMTLEEMDVEYVPSYRKSTYSGNGDGTFSIKSSIVELAD